MSSRSVGFSYLVLRKLKIHIQANISKQKAALQKHAVVVKTQQKEVQTATLELGPLYHP